jgi:creatinine amidohydrolase
MLYLDQNKDSISQYTNIPVILPIGATEQHATIPLGTDTFILDFVLQKVENTISEKIIILPTIWVGFSHEHEGFPGTLSLSVETIQSIIFDIASWISTSLFKKVIILNSHGGNESPLKIIIEKWNNKKTGTTLFYEDVWSNESNDTTIELFGGIDIHAGDSESSVMAEIRPDLVTDGEIQNGYIEKDKESKTFYDKTETGAVNFKKNITINKNKGKILLNKMTIDLIQKIENKYV